MTASQALTKRQRKGAATAGIVGFVIASAGWLSIVLVFGAYVVSFVGYLLSVFFSSDDPYGMPPYDVRVHAAQLMGFRASDLVPVTVGGCIVGAVFIALGLLVSIRILTRHAVDHAVGVTWLGFGLSIIGSWILDGMVLGVTLLFAATTSGDFGNDPLPPIVGPAVLGFLTAIAIPALLGWLCWWGMAHALRRRPGLAEQSTQPQLVPGS
jgi:amino acid transporter